MYDIRDGSDYTVAKLPDGNCWMTQNLRLGDSQERTLHSSDSDVSSDWVLPVAQTSGSGAWAVDTKHVYAQSNTTYGNLYNWYTATAGTGTSSMTSASATNLNNAASSVCPKGWRLPDGGTSATKSWYTLDIALGRNGTNRYDATQRDKFINAPYSFPYSGHYLYSGGLSNQGSYGHWWSRSAWTSAGQAYAFSLLNNGYVYPQLNSNVGYGFPVRCVAR